MSNETMDWQTSKHDLRSRATYLLETEKYSDCVIFAGQRVFKCHKLILTMSSPVFEKWFFGNSNSLVILNAINVNAFEDLLNYIYKDKIDITSIQGAINLCHVAKKYKFPYVVDKCIDYLWLNVNTESACRVYEFATFLKNTYLQKKCLHIIRKKTLAVIQDNSFEKARLSTIMKIFRQDCLNIDNELSLFCALNRYAEKNQQLIDNNSEHAVIKIEDQDQEPRAKVPRLSDVSENSTQRQITIRDIVKKIRFLTLSPDQFAAGLAQSKLLNQSESFAILMNISTSNAVQKMPKGFSLSKSPRQVIKSKLDISSSMPTPDEQRMIEDKRYSFCIRTAQSCKWAIITVKNSFSLECSFTLSTNKDITLLGLRIYTQQKPSELSNHYKEVIYAKVLDQSGKCLSYSYFRHVVSYDSVVDIFFNDPVCIKKNENYKIGAVLHKFGCYNDYQVQQTVRDSDVIFQFNQHCNNNRNGIHHKYKNEGIIRGMIYNL